MNNALGWIGSGVMSIRASACPFFDEEDPAPDISSCAVHSLYSGCPLLVTVQFTDGLVGFAPEAFAMFGKFTKLRKIVSLYDELVRDRGLSFFLSFFLSFLFTS